MSKLLPALVFIMLIQLAGTLFLEWNIGENSLFTFITNPENWSLTAFWDAMVGSSGWITLIAGVGIAIGTLINSKSDFLVFGTMAAAFFSFGTTFYNLWQVVYSNMGRIDTSMQEPLTILLLSPVILAYVVVILEWWRQN